MRSPALLIPLVLLALMASSCRQIGPPGGGADTIVDTWNRSSSAGGSSGGGYSGNVLITTGGGSSSSSSSSSGISSSSFYRQINVRQDMVRKGTVGRKVVRPMRPRYITIHSTQNWTADAAKHSQALKNGALRATKRRGGNRIGFLIWHFTVDQRVAIQHMPTNEQGEHADFDGPGNNYSIGIEMCENRGNSRQATVERTAKLTAYLMKQHGIPLSNVVPHYHWPRRGCSPAHKNCPWFLLDNGRPGSKWRAFLSKVNFYYKQIG
jgi:N-acetylmuramoyl-L-alanine amidase